MIHAASRQSVAVVRDRLSGLLEGRTGDAAQSAATNRALSEDLGSVADLLTHEPRLRRTLGDSSTDSARRGELAEQLLTGKVGDEALTIVTTAVGQRWSNPWDLVDAIYTVSEDVLLASAEQQGQLDEVEDELFRFERILADNGELVTTLDENLVPAERRIDLLRNLIGDKVNPITFELIAHAVSSGRKVSLELAMDDLLEASAVRRNRSVARVISASELTDTQSTRLEAALTQLYGRPISVRSAINPAVQGGLEVRVGDELIDGTVASRMAAAKLALGVS